MTFNYIRVTDAGSSKCRFQSEADLFRSAIWGEACGGARATWYGARSYARKAKKDNRVPHSTQSGIYRTWWMLVESTIA